MPRGNNDRPALYVVMSYRKAARTLSREGLIAFCQAEDPNGTWTDEDARAAGMKPATRQELAEIVLDWSEDLMGLDSPLRRMVEMEEMLS